MDIKKAAMAGTLESSDVLIKISPAKTLEITIQSPVLKQFGEQMELLVQTILKEQNIQSGLIEVIDHGALDCTIAARLRTALARSREA